MAKRFAFDIAKAIPAAWEVLWADNLKVRAKEKKHGGRWYAATFYLCAVDLERQVRAFAQDTVEGKPWRKDRAFGGYGFGGIRIKGNLQHMVRNWLFAQRAAGKLASHNFGRGHISGERFRPYGDPMSPQETKTNADNAKPRKPRPCHYSGSGYGGRPACVVRKNRGYSYRSSKAWTTRDKDNVTCVRCLNLKPWGCAEISSDAA